MSAPRLEWTEGTAARDAAWLSGSGTLPPRRVQAVDDTVRADDAFHMACEGVGLLWRGDFQNARQLLQALARRLDKRAARSPLPDDMLMRERFNRYRQGQALRARVLGMVLIPLDAAQVIPLRRAPDVRAALHHALGMPLGDAVVSLRELQGMVGAYEWHRKGVPIAALGGATIHPDFGVFSPIRGEYLDLVARAPLPVGENAFDIGTGTGVLAAVLAQRGVPTILASDLSPQALACARANVERLGLSEQIAVQEADLFPQGRAALAVCNPPWLPGKASSTLEQAVYDPDSRMLRGFLDGLAAHLLPGGEGWLILSDLAEHLGLRSREQLLGMIEAAGLGVIERLDARPQHGKAFDTNDPLHAARLHEITSLWRLRVARS
ncbi:class I SAM-dependent methyltransferase [Pseudoroseomonas wenyumeiae]|uniref:Class I SAM-dependent methyltransferase n=1 Tax=Teichococcus wenyumeiae TaxID=2478470 RepID=A0ABX9VCX1_9PROT|nr:class I SAM-dependent methyltransferase [Pseudoroseomonas wenyumeiae]RMI17069.1 class I SAM-dependent methyltransferase [Pseudoroseomonas wenyumeiae]